MRFEEFKNGIMKDLEWTIRWVGGDQDPRTKSKQKKCKNYEKWISLNFD